MFIFQQLERLHDFRLHPKNSAYSKIISPPKKNPNWCFFPFCVIPEVHSCKHRKSISTQATQKAFSHESFPNLHAIQPLPFSPPVFSWENWCLRKGWLSMTISLGLGSLPLQQWHRCAKIFVWEAKSLGKKKGKFGKGNFWFPRIVSTIMVPWKMAGYLNGVTLSLPMEHTSIFTEP